MQYSIIQKSQLEGAKRLDAEYYQPEYLITKNKLMEYKNIKPLSELATIKTGPVYSSEKIGESFEVPLARIGDVTNKNDIENWVKLSIKEFEKFKYNKINDRDILMTMTGDPPDVGKVNFINNNKNINLAFNQRVAKLSSNSSSISNEFLFAFLSTEHARYQTERAALGIRQRNLGVNDLRNILIIIPPKKNIEFIESIINNYLDELENSKSLYLQAENLLLEELSIKEDELENKLSCVVKLSDVKTAKRFDAEYFQPKYQEIINKIRNNFNGVSLGEVVTIKKGIEPGADEYQENGKQFIRVSSLSKYGISDSEQKYLSDKLYQELKNDFEPKKGEILLTKDATPGIAYVIKENVEGIISSGILRLKLKNKEIEDEYLALCLNSIVGQSQAERDAGGSIIAHWKPEQVKNLIIPILSKDIQQKITGLIRESFEARKKSKELLDEAKRKVEEMIEAKL